MPPSGGRELRSPERRRCRIRHRTRIRRPSTCRGRALDASRVMRGSSAPEGNGAVPTLAPFGCRSDEPSVVWTTALAGHVRSRHEVEQTSCISRRSTRCHESRCPGADAQTAPEQTCRPPQPLSGGPSVAVGAGRRPELPAGSRLEMVLVLPSARGEGGHAARPRADCRGKAVHCGIESENPRRTVDARYPPDYTASPSTTRTRSGTATSRAAGWETNATVPAPRLPSSCRPMSNETTEADMESPRRPAHGARSYPRAAKIRLDRPTGLHAEAMERPR